MKTKYISKTHNAKGDKHPGIYPFKKDICPTPRRVPYQISLPVEVTQKLQDMYPELSLRMATQKYLTDLLGA